MAAPLPNRIAACRYALQPDTTWQETVRESLADLYLHAARPAREFVPASAAAVLFADRAEMLACLAMDWTSGELANRWWWQALYHGTSGDQFLVNEWLEHSGFIPAALDELSLRGEAVKFVRSLGEENVHRLCSAVINSYGLKLLWPLVVEDLTGCEHKEAVEQMSLQTVQAKSADFAVTISPAPPKTMEAPWTRWVPEGNDRGLNARRQLLLGVALMAHRAAPVLRSPAFARDVVSWYKRERLSWREIPDPISSNSGAVGEELRPAPVVEAVADRALLGEELQNGMPGCEKKAVSPGTDHPPFVKQSLVKSGGQAQIGSPSAEHDGTSAGDHGAAGLPGLTKKGQSPPDPGIYSNRQEMPPLVVPGGRTETELGGLFYLINVATSLDLYPDFTKPAEAGLPMPVWDFIEIVGRRMLHGRFRRDPVWGLLARLSGRSGREPPGKYFEPPGDWRIPAVWLKPFCDHSIWTWSVKGDRLLVRHREGFCILDVSVKRNARHTLRQETARYVGTEDFVLRKGREWPAAAPPLEWWSSRLVPFLLARLRLAFGVTRNRDVVRLLLYHHARLEDADARLDINLALSDLPIEIRLAGLDHDPGWVPAAGRVVSFHYS